MGIIRRIALTIIFLLAFALLATSVVSAQSAVIAVNPEGTQTPINKLIFGQNLFVNFWGVNADNPSKLKNALRKTGATILRFPGGLYSDEFHWYESIGPKDKRPQVCYQADYGKIFFGLDEFLDLAEEVGAEVVFTVNEDRAEPAEIKDFVEYTNGEVPSNTSGWSAEDWRHGKSDSSGYIPGSMPKGYYAWLRSQPGYGEHPTPWKIKYVEVGNEIFAPYCPKQSPDSFCHEIPGQCAKCENQVENGCPSPPGIGRRYNTLNISCEDAGNVNNRTGVYKYIDRVNEFVNVIKSVDPDIEIGAVGLNGSPTCQWNRILLNDPVAQKIDFIIDHPYLPAAPPQKHGYSFDSPEYSQGIVSGAVETERNLLLPEWKRLLKPKNLKLANTEHSAAYTLSTDEGNDLKGALMTAGRFHTWLKESSVEVVLYWHTGMSAMYHNWQNENPIAGPTALVYKLYADYLQDKIIEVNISNNPSHQTQDLTYGLGAFQAEDLDVLASISNDRKTLSIFIINRNIKRSNKLTIDLGGFGYIQAIKSVLKTKHPDGTKEALLANTNSDPNAIYIETKSLEANNQQRSQAISPHTLTVLQFNNCNKADLNCDGKVSIADLLSWRRFWAQGDSRGDVNGDGRINLVDYLELLREWLK